MKISISVNTGHLRLEAEAAIDLVHLGALSAKTNCKTYQIQHGNDARFIEIPLTTVLNMMLGER
jgi:hypothetical protein